MLMVLLRSTLHIRLLAYAVTSKLNHTPLSANKSGSDHISAHQKISGLHKIEGL